MPVMTKTLGAAASSGREVLLRRAAGSMIIQEPELIMVLEEESMNFDAGIRIVAGSNEEELGAKFTVASVLEFWRRDGGSLDAAAQKVFWMAWEFLMSFSRSTNAETPRRLFAGVVWGILDLQNLVDVFFCIQETILAPKVAPFLYQTTGRPDSEIQGLVRNWTNEHPEKAREVLKEIYVEFRLRGTSNPTPLGCAICESIVYALFKEESVAKKIKMFLSL